MSTTNTSRRTSALIICLDSTTSSDPFSSYKSLGPNRELADLSALSETCSVPVYLISTRAMNPLDVTAFLPFQVVAAAYNKTGLSQLLTDATMSGISSILVAGSYAETLVTDVTLAALVEGYDTFVVWDQIVGMTKRGREAAEARLLQAGAVPTSIDRLLHRWD